MQLAHHGRFNTVWTTRLHQQIRFFTGVLLLLHTVFLSYSINSVSIVRAAVVRPAPSTGTDPAIRPLPYPTLPAVKNRLLVTTGMFNKATSRVYTLVLWLGRRAMFCSKLVQPCWDLSAFL
jgi:hypothetical protein